MTQDATTGLQVELSRVILHLPVGSSNPVQSNRAYDAAMDVIRYLEGQRVQGRLLGGFTNSLLRPPVYQGHYWSRTENQWIVERVATFIIDYNLLIDGREFTQTIRRLERAVRTRYARRKVPQDLIWIVAERVFRYRTPTEERAD